MRAAIVSVDFGDLLQITLPYNRHHFKEVMVVTAPADYKTQEVARQNDAGVYVTDRFYTDGADFNKWASLEEGLDAYGRHGLMCIMDADVLWPKKISHDYQVGNLYSPCRFIHPDITRPIPVEARWKYCQKFTDYEWAGYTQIFWADDPHLPQPPWHETNWKHAGGADSFFQILWPIERKIRPNWKVLHLGSPGKNWCGRCTPFTDGSMPESAQEREQKVRHYWNLRAQNRHTERGPYQAEKL